MDNFNYYINGMISGFTATVFSHPAYNIKTVLQVGEKIENNQIKSLKWLYRGFTRAALGYSGEKMIVFGTYNTLLSHSFNPTIAGIISGASGAIITTVSEQLAIDKVRGVCNYRFSHLYSGFYPTIMRESLGFGVHFTVYNWISNKINPEREMNKTFICGTIAVICGWTTVTPIDRLKTLFQTGKIKFDRKILSEIHHNVFTGAFRGFSYVMARAIPFHTISFCTMEYLNKNNKFNKEVFYLFE